MILAAQWQGPVKFTVLSVDHRLRPQSHDEAVATRDRARSLGFAAHVLTWRAPKAVSGLQARAREARYRLMADWCAKHGAEGVVTAHTLDDQAETLLMRLARGAGVDGLAAMEEEHAVYGARVLRPLLATTREALRAHLSVRKASFFEDPSNADPSFERIRFRQAREQLAALGLKPQSLALTARRLGRARQALERAADELEGRAVEHHAEGHAIIARAAFEAAPAEIRLRLLVRLLIRIGGASPPPRLSEVEALSAWLAETGSGRSRTLGGCRVQKRGASLIVGREFGRMSARPIRIKPGETLLWDARYRITLERGSGRPMTVVPLGEAKNRKKVARPKSLPDFVFKALPALVKNGKVALVPQIGYRARGDEKSRAEILPVAPSRHN
jgi:tRNA(Ile)-lysidine synthase